MHTNIICDLRVNIIQMRMKETVIPDAMNSVDPSFLEFNNY